MKSIHLVISLVIVLSSGILFGQDKVTMKPKRTKKAKTAVVSFKKDITPIIKKYCMSCHAEDQMNPSGLDMDEYGDILKGGKHGPTIIAGSPDSSLIVKKISLTPPFGDPMPMKRKTAFPADTLKIIRQWIEQGAKNN